MKDFFNFCNLFKGVQRLFFLTYGATQRYHCNQIDIVEIKKADAVSVRVHSELRIKNLYYVVSEFQQLVQSLS